MVYMWQRKVICLHKKHFQLCVFSVTFNFIFNIWLILWVLLLNLSMLWSEFKNFSWLNRLIYLASTMIGSICPAETINRILFKWSMEIFIGTKILKNNSLFKVKKNFLEKEVLFQMEALKKRLTCIYKTLILLWRKGKWWLLLEGLGVENHLCYIRF